MQADTLLALFLFAFTTSITPGPNNMMLFASGVNFGFVRTIPHMFGIGAGFLSLLIAVGLGLGALLHSVPMLYTGLKFAGGAYLVWIAWKIGTSRTLSEGKASAVPMTFLQAAAFQWINPKAWVMAVTAMATYTSEQSYLLSVLIVGVIFAIVNVPSVSTWAGFGSALRQWLSDPVRLKWFNITMAVLLVLSLWPMLR
ncbi:LysE family translocator [Pararhizobium sp. BT-229]|uniref:LysE family translocator n=1 Tax=Pararhizobium sp. BT-229 TaxID=2986923 RepID=UPI0021F6C82C|nr:LysE family translocator [Pararhizobium sp. BT-229]MCV9960956.1 LysE family translocator [Pararhizobium sp. BT-229]